MLTVHYEQTVVVELSSKTLIKDGVDFVFVDHGSYQRPGGLYGDSLGTYGRAVQVDPIKPPLKAPGNKRLKLRCDIMLSNFAVKFKLRRYTTVTTSFASRC
jgi:hypothetical protein